VSEKSKGDKEERSDEELIHLPRASFFSRVSGTDLFRIGMFATLLVAIIVMRKPCADNVGKFFGNFDEGDAGPPAAETSGADAARGLEGYRLIPAEEAIDVLSDGGSIDDLE